MKLNPYLAMFLGTAAASAYFAVSERGIPKESNCSYLAPASTDFAAWIIGGLVAWRGVVHKDPLIAFAGATMATIHVAQFAAHKVSTRPSAQQLEARNAVRSDRESALLSG